VEVRFVGYGWYIAHKIVTSSSIAIAAATLTIIS
jgi:hypothetical protein